MACEINYFPYVQEPKPWSLWDRVRLLFRRSFYGYGWEFKVMDGTVWLIKEASRGK